MIFEPTWIGIDFTSAVDNSKSLRFSDEMRRPSRKIVLTQVAQIYFNATLIYRKSNPCYI